MSNYRIIEVDPADRKALKRFITFPDRLYRDCPQYVPALHSDQVHSLTRVSTLSYCSRKMWLLLDGEGKVAGRICAMVNPRYNERFGKKRARFGWFDTVNDLEAARLLLSTAEAWAKSQGMEEVHGPLYYNTLGKQGMLVEGFENTPPFNCLYNYAYYNDLVTALGYEKECDWIQYKVVSDQGVPDKMKRIAALLREKYKLHVGSIDRLKKDPKQVRRFFEIYNESFAGAVYNFIPFTDEEIEEETKASMPFLSDRASTIVLDENEDLVAFGITFPSISEALKKCRGKFFPFGWFHLLRALHGRNKLGDLMLNGAAPKWHNTGVSAIYHCALAEKYAREKIHWSITNPQIETNSAVNVWDKYEHELYMRRRCYIKKI